MITNKDSESSKFHIKY